VTMITAVDVIVMATVSVGATGMSCGSDGEKDCETDRKSQAHENYSMKIPLRNVPRVASRTSVSKALFARRNLGG